jgi:hypothetical protein
MSGFISLSEVTQKVEKPLHAKDERYLIRIARLRVISLVSNLVDNSCDYRKRCSLDGPVQLVDEGGPDFGLA